MHDRAVKIFQVYKNLLILGLLGIPIGLVVGGSMRDWKGITGDHGFPKRTSHAVNSIFSFRRSIDRLCLFKIRRKKQ